MLKNKNEDAQFLKLAKKYNSNYTVVELLKEFHTENKQYKQALTVIFEWLNNKNDLSHRSENAYFVAQNFIKIVKESPYKEIIDVEVHTQIQKVLILLITTGMSYTVYNVASNASWWLQYEQLKNEYLQEWSQNYKDIIKRLEKKYQKNIYWQFMNPKQILQEL